MLGPEVHASVTCLGHQESVAPNFMMKFEQSARHHRLATVSSANLRSLMGARLRARLCEHVRRRRQVRRPGPALREFENFVGSRFTPACNTSPLPPLLMVSFYTFWMMLTSGARVREARRAKSWERDVLNVTGSSAADPRHVDLATLSASLSVCSACCSCSVCSACSACSSCSHIEIIVLIVRIVLSIESMDLKAIAGMHPTTACSACSSCSPQGV